MLKPSKSRSKDEMKSKSSESRLKRGYEGGAISGSAMLRQTPYLHQIGGASSTLLNDWHQIDIPQYVSANPFHFLSPSEKALLTLSVSIAIITGGVLAVLSYYTGAIADPLTLPSRSHLFTPYIIIMGALMIAAFLGFAASAYLQETLAERQICRIRKLYMKHLLRQDTAWYDLHSDENLTSFLTENLRLIKSGTGLKFLRLMNCLGTIVVATVMGFIKLWSLTLVSFLVAFPLMIGLTALFLKRHAKHTKICTEKSVLAIATAEEDMINVRTISAFSLQDKMYQKFVNVLVATYEEGIKAALHIGLGEMSKAVVIGATYLGAFALIGFLMLRDIRKYGEEACAADNSPCLSGGVAMGTFYLATTPCFVVLNANTSLNALSPAIASIKTMTERLKSLTTLDSTETSQGIQNLNRFRGRITLERIRFAYPQKPGKQIYNSIDLDIPEGKTVALVGGSGCGKSTLAQLVCRLYDPDSGRVMVDGTDIKHYNLKWYREQLAVVSQEPRLFSASIFENIQHGSPFATEEEVYAAAKMANAHDFIMTLADQYQTPCGEGGSQLSGGQKQRIAIARAFLRRPSILVLDEATSALDTKSERMVQETLSKLVKELKCTTIIIAHRLSTIRDADMIVVFARNSDAGAEIVEVGSHDELLSKNGVYAQLVAHQMINVDETALDDSEDSSESAPAPPPPDNDAPRPSRAVLPAANSPPKGDGFKRLIQILGPDRKSFYLSVTYALANSLTFPIWGAVFGVLGAKFMTANEADISKATRDSILAYAFFTVYGGIFGGMQFRYAAALKEKGRRALRKTLMANLLYKDMAFFDDPDHDAGSLTEAFSIHTSQASQWLGDALSLTVQFGFGIVVACVVAMLYSWIAGLITFGLNLLSVPLLLHAGAATAATEARLDASDDDRDPEAPAFIMYETIENMLAVKLFTMDENISSRYSRAVDDELKEACKSMRTASFLYSELNLIPWLLEYLLIWILGVMIRKTIVDFPTIYPALNAIQFVSFGFGSLAAELGDFGKARRSAGSIFELADAPSTINEQMKPSQIDQVPSSLAMPSLDWSRGIEFRSVSFAYPQRLHAPVYKDLSFHIPPGYTVAFVGSSGCGKSTGIQLIERFYDVSNQNDNGGIFIGGIDVREWNLKELRGMMSLVSQEPKLFATSIKDNIAMGSETIPTSDSIEHAADMAEVTNFAKALEDGMETDVGKRGERLSGGQRQRVAIARALIRRPRILILDEATSALDAESEALVQASLDRLTSSPELAETITIVIAHRLSTIRDVDRVYVLDNSDGQGSKLIQQGSFNELMQDKNGEFYKLAQNAH